MSASTWLTWRVGVWAFRTSDAAVTVEGHGVRLSFRNEDPAITQALLGLIPPGCEEDRLADTLLEAAGPQALATWYHAIDRLGRRALLTRSVRSPRGPLATLTPLSAWIPSTARHEALEPGRRYQLARLAHLRREGIAMILESPTSHARVILHDPAAAALVAGLAAPSSISQLQERAAGLPDRAVPLVMGLLEDAGMVEAADRLEEGGDVEAKPIGDSVDAWEFHDLLFHARSRRGRTDRPLGANYRLAGRMDLLPPVRQIPEGVARPLLRPDLTRLEAEDPPLSRVVESRRSERVYGRPPIHARQLGEFLYRVARIRGEHELDVDTPAGERHIAMLGRPYPSGGALYELEFYAAVAACDEIEAGLHYYEPRGHSLIPIRELTADVEGLLRDAAESAGIPRESLQVLLILSARLPRIAWKYESVAYSLVLKHVGVVYHAMYLAATAMGLAPCALGAGDSDLFARASGNDYYAETSVGEFLLGSRPASEAASR